MRPDSLIKFLDGKKVYIQTHDYPDPDALASAFGVQVFLKYYGINAVICYEGNISKSSTRMMMDTFNINAVHIGSIRDDDNQRCIIIVDAQKNNSNIAEFSGRDVACVDHHPPIQKNENYIFSDIRICGACSSIISGYFKENDIIMDGNTAAALLYGIKMDTDSFNRGVTDFDIEMYAYLNKYADKRKIAALTNNKLELGDLQAYGEAIKNIQIFGNVGFSRIPFDCPDALIAMISDFILGLDVVNFSVVYAGRDGGIKFSVRSATDELDAGIITRKALMDYGGGGGHAVMAGGYIGGKNSKKLGEEQDKIIKGLFLNTIDEYICEHNNK